MTKDKQKKLAAYAAIEKISVGDIVGVGTGSTVEFFIDALTTIKSKIDGVVSSSHRSTELLTKHGFKIHQLTDIGSLPIYIDGADEATRHRQLIKGGGGALTSEKIIASSSQRFVCILDESKLVPKLGNFALPIEVIPMARGLVARKIIQLGGIPTLRPNFTSDHNNVILDVKGLSLLDPIEMEQKINQIPGVVCVGLFASRRANEMIIGKNNEVEYII